MFSRSFIWQVGIIAVSNKAHNNSVRNTLTRSLIPFYTEIRKLSCKPFLGYSRFVANTKIATENLCRQTFRLKFSILSAKDWHYLLTL